MGKKLRYTVAIALLFCAAFVLGFLENYRLKVEGRVQFVVETMEIVVACFVLFAPFPVAFLERSPQLGFGLGGAMVFGEICGLLSCPVRSPFLTPWMAFGVGLQFTLLYAGTGLLGSVLPPLPEMFESLFTVWLRAKSLLAGGSAQDVISHRKERKMKDEEVNALEGQLDQNRQELEQKEGEFKAKYRQLQEKHPDALGKVGEILERVSNPELSYKGWFREMERRFQFEQVRKSAEKRRETATAARRLIEELTGLANDIYENRKTHKEIDVKLERLQGGDVEEKTQLEMDIEKLRLEKEKAALEHELWEIRRSEEGEEREEEGIRERLNRKVDTTKMQMEAMLDADVAEAQIEAGGLLDFARARDEMLKERFGDKDYEGLNEQEKREYDYIVAFFEKKMDERF